MTYFDEYGDLDYLLMLLMLLIVSNLDLDNDERNNRWTVMITLNLALLDPRPLGVSEDANGRREMKSFRIR